MFRTPAKDKTFEVSHSPDAADRAEPAPSVRRSIEKWQTVEKKKNTSPRTPPKKKTSSAAGPSRPTLKITLPQENKTTRRPPVEASGSPKLEPVYPTRAAEARACLNKARHHLGNSKNLKTEIKMGVIEAIERLYELVMRDDAGKRGDGRGEEEPLHPPPISHPDPPPPSPREDDELRRRMEEHCHLMQENTKRMVELSDRLQKHEKALNGGRSYASVAAGNGGPKPAVQTALHSMVIASKDDTDTAEQVLNMFREAVTARQGGANVEKVRKVRDGKIIVGCVSAEEREKVKERILSTAGDQLTAQEIKNKNPLLILKNVDITCNDDEEIEIAFKNQNTAISTTEGTTFDYINGDYSSDDYPLRVRVIYKRKTRNPKLNHVVMRVSPLIWTRAMKAGVVWINLQKVRVEDQSPLVQCSLCLGYGHTRRFCTETEERCSHCAGPHKKAECPDWPTTTPTCCNCMDAKLHLVEHNAFSTDCPVRQKWDALAREKTAYYRDESAWRLDQEQADQRKQRAEIHDDHEDSYLSEDA